jgi:hypothetical protein
MPPPYTMLQAALLLLVLTNAAWRERVHRVDCLEFNQTDTGRSKPSRGSSEAGRRIPGGLGNEPVRRVEWRSLVRRERRGDLPEGTADHADQERPRAGGVLAVVEA